MENEIKPLNDTHLSLSNIATRSAQGFTMREKRVFSFGLTQVNSHPKAKPRLTMEERTIRITAKEYAEAFDIADPKSAYKDIKKGTEAIFNRYLRYLIPTPKGVKERRLRWVSSSTYHEGEGWVSYVITEEIMPQLMQLGRNYTNYRLRQTTELRSLYSWRFLELFTSYLDAKNETKPKTVTLEVEELRYRFEIPASYKWNDIKKRVIEPATKELTGKDNWVIEWQPIKKGRSVVSIKFTFSKNRQGDMFSV